MKSILCLITSIAGLCVMLTQDFGFALGVILFVLGFELMDMK